MNDARATPSSNKRISKILLMSAASIVSGMIPMVSHAWFFIIPLPNLAKPPALQKIIDALERSNETKAIAYVSEDKTFGSKQWVWGHHSGGNTQQLTEQIALQKCEATLNATKSQTAGGQPLYDFGAKKCELHEFTNPYKQPANAPTPQSDTSKPSQSDVESRLQNIKSLFDKGLLTKEDYDLKRQEIMKSL